MQKNCSCVSLILGQERKKKSSILVSARSPMIGLGCFQTNLYTEHKHRSSMPCPWDTCNSCECYNGSISTTLMECDGNSCFKDGIEYKDGSTVPLADGCNDCGCVDGKASMCTKLPCPPSLVITDI